jgi:hypothetical protein
MFHCQSAESLAKRPPDLVLIRVPSKSKAATLHEGVGVKLIPYRQVPPIQDVQLNVDDEVVLGPKNGWTNAGGQNALYRVH